MFATLIRLNTSSPDRTLFQSPTNQPRCPMENPETDLAINVHAQLQI